MIFSQVKEAVRSIAQAIVYKVTLGKLKTANHILLPWTVKTLTGNTDLIRILYHLENGISQTTIEEIITSPVIEKAISTEESSVPLPFNVFPNVTTTVAHDNSDRTEEN